MASTGVIVGAVVATGVVLYLVVNASNQAAIATQQVSYQQAPNQGPLPAGSEGNILYGILAGLGVGIGGVLAGSRSGNSNNSNGQAPSGQNGGQASPANQQQQQSPTGYDPSRPIGPGNSPVSGFNFPRVS